MICRIIYIPTYITEKTFLEYMKSLYNLEGFRFSKGYINEIRNALLRMNDYQKKWSIYSEIHSKIFKLFGKGNPDFFLYNKEEFMFCEFKAQSDSLSIDQISWFDENQDLPLAIAVCSKDTNIMQENILEDKREKQDIA